MKIFFKVHTGFTFILGLIYLLYPYWIIHHIKPDSFEIARMMGFAVVTPGFLTLLMARTLHNREMIINSLFVLSVFHLGLLLTSALASARGQVLVFVPFAHGIFALFFILLIFRHAKGNTRMV